MSIRKPRVCSRLLLLLLAATTLLQSRPVDADLADQLVWTSSRGDTLSTGSGHAPVLSVGTHVLAASVTDAAGLTGSDAVTVTVVPADSGTVDTLVAAEDAFTHGRAVYWNTGYLSYIRVRPQGDDAERIGFVRFDPSVLDGDVAAAVLRLYVDELSTPGTLQVHAVQGPWTDAEIVHHNRPPIAADFVSGDIASQGGYVDIDVTPIVRSWQAAPHTAYGFALASGGALDAYFGSSEHRDAPLLEVTTTRVRELAPVVAITSPPHGAVVLEGRPVPLVATATASGDPASADGSPVVPAAGGGSVLLSWLPPTEYDDGTPLRDLAGYTIHWDGVQNGHTGSLTVDNPGLTAFIIENLVPGSYTFTMTAYNADGVESYPSNAVRKVVP